MPLAARRHRPRTGAVGLLAIAVLLAGCSGSDDEGVPYTGTMLTSTPPTTATGGEPTTAAPAPTSTEPGSTPDPGADGVARVLFVGDSLTFGALGTLKARFENAGAQVRYVGAPGTGILSGGSWWLEEVAGQLTSFAPDVVVVEDCCNYDGGDAGYTLDDGTVVHQNTKEMFAAWRKAAQDAIDLVRGAGATIHWVVTPAIGDRPEVERDRVDRYNAIVEDLGVPLVDWRSALTPDGTFELEIEIDGTATPVRNDDQIHLLPAGNALVTEVTWDAIADELGLTDG